MLNTVTPANRYNPITPVANQTLQPRQGVFYALDQELTRPTTIKPQSLGLFNSLIHPVESFQLNRRLKANPVINESFGQRVAMYRAVKKHLSAKGRSYLWQQLVNDRLTDTKADDNRSTLSHLYAMISMPRANGLNGSEILEDTLRLMTEPQTITQKFGSLKPQYMQAMLQYYRGGQGPKTKDSIDVNLLRNVNSATCVASSVMYYMASRCPAEFTRHIAQLTSPRLAFWEKANMNEISPDDPSKAAQILSEYGIPATAVPGTNGAQYWVKVSLPYPGLIWAANQQGVRNGDSRSPVEAAYQASLTHLAAQSYDPGIDMRINPDGTFEYNKGLEEERKTLMESIIKDNGGVMSVTYMLHAGGRDDEPYLIGYFRSFDDTKRDLIQALDAKETVLIGIVSTDPLGQSAGRFDMKHEITVVGYKTDKKTGELMFEIADSDDGIKRSVWRSARELIPMIHHAGFPVKQAQGIWKDIHGRLKDQYMVPDQRDGANYKLVATVPPAQQKAFLEDYERRVKALEAQQQQTGENGQAAQPPQQQQQPQPPQAPIVQMPLNRVQPYFYPQPVPYPVVYYPQRSSYSYPQATYYPRPTQAYYPQTAHYATGYPPYNYYGNPWYRSYN